MQVIDVSDSVARIGAVYYSSLESAILGILNGETTENTIELLQDVEIEKEYTITKDITINANSNSTTLTGKDGKALKVPNVPDFSPSSNYGSLTSVGRGFVVTANHVESPQDKSQTQLRKWGLSSYDIAQLIHKIHNIIIM